MIALSCLNKKKRQIMKTILKLFISLVVIVIAEACTQNNGEIDPWFGFWRLTGLSADGETVDDYNGNMVWSFQNNIVCMTTTFGVHERTECWATWRQDGEYLLIDFDNHEDSGVGIYTPPEVLRMSGDGVNRLEITGMSGKHITLSGATSDGAVMIYYLEKVY